jgi:hypothetical protein
MCGCCSAETGQAELWGDASVSGERCQATGSPKLGLTAGAVWHRVPATTGLLGLRRLDAAFGRAVDTTRRVRRQA